jgi:hypothetical protein
MSELAQLLLNEVKEKGDGDVMISVQVSNKLYGGFDDIKIVRYGNHVEVRAEQGCFNWLFVKPC